MPGVREHVRTTCPRDCYDACGIVAIKRGGAGAVIDQPLLQFADLAFLTPSGRIEIVGPPAAAAFFWDCFSITGK